MTDDTLNDAIAEDALQQLAAIECVIRLALPVLDRWIGTAPGYDDLRMVRVSLEAAADSACRPGRRLLGCQCTWEWGDSPCPVHPNYEDNES